MSSQEDTPCDSNDYQLSLYPSLLDDDEYILNIVPCVNATAENGGVNSGVVISGEDGTMDGVIISGGGGESSVETTVPSRTTPIWEPAVDEGDEDITVNWDTTDAPTTTSEITTTSQATTTVEVTTAPTEPLFSTEGANAEVESSNGQGSESVASDKPSNGITTPDKESDNSSSESEAASTGETIHQETSKESSFYTCHPNPTALQSGEFEPEDTAATKIRLIYDYELVTSGGIDLDTELDRLENDMTEDLANQYGLVDCAARLRRRLRKKQSSGEGVVALDSDPIDEVLDGQSCTTQVDTNTICTPVRGYMTVWSESDDTSGVLQSIESGMNSGSYESDMVKKLVYIGVPTNEQLQSDANGASRSQEMENIESQPGTSVFLPVGIAIIALAIACIAFFIARRRKNDDRNGPKPDNRSQPLSQLEAPPTIDLEDDINLLPSPEKMDMRPIYTDSDIESAGRGSPVDMETGGEDDAPMKQLDDDDLHSVESSVFSKEEDSVESGSAASSGLAAMGAASTLATRMGSDSNA